MAGVAMTILPTSLRTLILQALAAPSHAVALARVDELEVNKAALDLLARSNEARADEAERKLDLEQMIAATAERQRDRLTAEVARLTQQLADHNAPPSWLVPRDPDSDVAPGSIRPVGEQVLRAEVASVRRAIRDFCATVRVFPDQPWATRVLTVDVDKLRAMGVASKGAASCACSSVGARASDADEILMGGAK
jgi:hypothetical protein